MQIGGCGLAKSRRTRRPVRLEAGFLLEGPLQREESPFAPDGPSPPSRVACMTPSVGAPCPRACVFPSCCGICSTGGYRVRRRRLFYVSVSRLCDRAPTIKADVQPHPSRVSPARTCAIMRLAGLCAFGPQWLLCMGVLRVQQ
jgi:hypothetical protein